MKNAAYLLLLLSSFSEALPTILLSLTLDEAIETTKMHSEAGWLSDRSGLIRTRPFRETQSRPSP